MEGKVMQNTKITDTIQYVGTDDKNIDLFESQYIVPNGVSYNSYVIAFFGVKKNCCASRRSSWRNSQA